MQTFKFQGVEYNIPTHTDILPVTEEGCFSVDAHCTDTLCSSCVFAEENKVIYRKYLEHINEEQVHEFGDSL